MAERSNENLTWNFKKILNGKGFVSISIKGELSNYETAIIRSNFPANSMLLFICLPIKP